MPATPRLLPRPAWPVVLIVLLPLLAAPAQGQIDRWGLKAGATSMTAGGEGLADEGIGRTTGFLVGGTARAGLVGRLSLRAELLYLRKGWSATVRTFQGEPTTSTLTLDYLELPVLADVAIGSVWGVTGRVHAGPTLGIRVHSGVDTEGDAPSTDPDDTLRRTEVGIAVGGSASGSVGAQTLQLDVRYQLSLTNINEPSPQQTLDDQNDSPSTIRLRGLSVALGLVF